MKSEGGTARASGRQSQISSQAFASQSSSSPSHSDRGKAEKATVLAKTLLGVEDGPDRRAHHRSTFGGARIGAERSDGSPVSAWPSGCRAPPSLPSISSVRSAGDLRTRSERRSWHCSGSGTSDLSPVRQQRAASEPSPTALQEEQCFSLCLTVQLSIPPVCTSARVPVLGDTESSQCANRDKEEADGSPLACRSLYDLSCVTDAVEDAAEAEIGPLYRGIGTLSSGDDGHRILVKATHDKEELLLPRLSEQASFELSWRSATTRSSEKPSNQFSVSCTMKPLRLTNLDTSLPPPRPVVATAPHTTLESFGSQNALAAVVTVEAQHLSTSQTITDAAAFNDEGPSSGNTQHRRPPKPSTVSYHGDQGGGQVIIMSSGSFTSSESSSREGSDAVAFNSASLSTTESRSDSTQSMYATGLRSELQTPLRQYRSRVHIRTGANEIDDASTISKELWRRQKPTSSIVIEHRLFDPEPPRPRGPRARKLPNGKRQANWTTPETHYATTLADLAACEEDEHDVEARRLKDALESDEAIDVNEPLSWQAGTQGSHSSPRPAPVAARGRVRAVVPARPPLSPSTVPQVSSSQSVASSLPLKAPAISAAKTIAKGSSKLAYVEPVAAAASADAHASDMRDSLKTSVNAGRRAGGIVVDEVEKALRLREALELAPGFGALQIQRASPLPLISSASTITSGAKPPLPSTLRHDSHLDRSTIGGEGAHELTNSRGNGASSCLARGGGAAGYLNLSDSKELRLHSTTGGSSLARDPFGLVTHP
ncbi:hypothetical protein GH5_01556 [Leishmania sp. Ghana 2012 LV757]|uniref:hypothetical protein n=1 Tax=Leishmania sp. Ghana 2012 LV757 TaxID=2803181 RepID=UPI001B5DAF34|nr:hypothetical protein GH5_01556 [Leishmania sp. Ghana 2012 LV757]